MTVFDEIAQALAAITPEQVERCARFLPPVKDEEEVLGTVPEHTQRLWALVYEYSRQFELSKHAAKYDTSNMEEANGMIATAARFNYLGELAKKAAWVESYDHLGQRAWTKRDTSLRAGFVVVINKQEEDDEEQKVEILGSIPISAEAIAAVKDAIRCMAKAREDAGSSLLQDAINKAKQKPQ